MFRETMPRVLHLGALVYFNFFKANKLRNNDVMTQICVLGPNDEKSLEYSIVLLTSRELDLYWFTVSNIIATID